MDRLEKQGRRSGFTLAPEAATERMREIINKPVNPLAERCLMSSAGGAPVFFAGDAFGGPRVEGAILSGLEAAQQILALRLPAK